MFKLFGGGNQPAESNPPTVPLEEIRTQPVPVPQQQSAQAQPKKEKGIFEFSSGYPRLQMALRIYCTVSVACMIVAAGYGFTGAKQCLPAFFFLLDAWLV